MHSVVFCSVVGVGSKGPWTSVSSLTLGLV